jgi:3-oxoacyl-[acyl-carrier protein] reductase
MASMTSGLLLSENVMLDLCAKAVAATMLSREIRGRIINMSSNCGKLGYPRLAAYCASKFGMIGFTQALALELARRESPSTPICPGLADTDRLDHLGRRPDGGTGGHHPLGRLASTEDVAEITAFLVSDGAAYVTGQAMNVAGGAINH